MTVLRNGYYIQRHWLLITLANASHLLFTNRSTSVKRDKNKFVFERKKKPANSKRNLLFIEVWEHFIPTHRILIRMVRLWYFSSSINQFLKLPPLVTFHFNAQTDILHFIKNYITNSMSEMLAILCTIQRRRGIQNTHQMFSKHSIIWFEAIDLIWHRAKWFFLFKFFFYSSKAVDFRAWSCSQSIFHSQFHVRFNRVQNAHTIQQINGSRCDLLTNFQRLLDILQM